MGTNYYANWRLTESSSGAPFSLSTEPVSVNLHICKSLVSFQGAVFNSWSAWKNFLEGQGERLSITDEYGRTFEVEQFIAEVEETDAPNRRRQYDWLLDKIGLGIMRDNWLDADGFSFHRGEFI